MTEGDGENRWDGRAVDDVVVGAADAAGQHRYADLPATRDKNRMVDDTRHPHCARPARRPGERIIVSLRGEMPARSAARRCALPAREQICSGPQECHGSRPDWPPLRQSCHPWVRQ